MIHDSDNELVSDNDLNSEPWSSKFYPIDTNKIQSIEDIKEIIKALDIRISIDNPNYENLKPYLKNQ